MVYMHVIQFGVNNQSVRGSDGCRDNVHVQSQELSGGRRSVVAQRSKKTPFTHNFNVSTNKTFEPPTYTNIGAICKSNRI